MYSILLAIVLGFLLNVDAKNPLFPRCPLFDKCAIVSIEGTLSCDHQRSNAGPQYIELWEDDNKFDDLVKRVEVQPNGTFQIQGRAEEFFTEGLGLFLKIFSTCGIKPRFYGKCWHVEEITIPDKYWNQLVYNDWDVIWKPANIVLDPNFNSEPFCESN